MNTATHYDVAIIGAGMAGLAAGIRLAHFGKRVCIFERHNAVGGLNSFYSISGRKYDVGLHAMTNWVPPGTKGTPLGKLLRQLRIERDEFALHPQKRSRIAFGPRGESSLTFTNDFAVLESEVAQKFPAQIDGFRALVALVRTYDDVSLHAVPESARAVVRRHLSDPLLEDMLFCPVMYYGSASEHDMEFGQFVIMFKALFLEGFARPVDGVRVILRVLLEKYRHAGGERRMKCGVKQIITESGRADHLLLDDGTEVTATHIISTIGAAETERLTWHGRPAPDGVGVDAKGGNMGETPMPRRADDPMGGTPLPRRADDPMGGTPMPRRADDPMGGTPMPRRADDPMGGTPMPRRADDPMGGTPLPLSGHPVGRLSYCETITVLDRPPSALGWGDDTIIFFNDSERFTYEQTRDAVDVRSGVICLPNNFSYPDGQDLPEGLFRCTCLANYNAWTSLGDEAVYQSEKTRWYGEIQRSALRFMPVLPSADTLARATIATDMFTPRTITKFTGHLGGAIYGSPVKIRDGRTPLANVYLAGTDQGFLGIVGAMLSGISMANFHVLAAKS